MGKHMLQKWNSRSGLVWAAVLLLIPIGVLLVLILWPAWQRFRYQSQQIGCNAALATAREQLSIDYIINDQDPTAEEARRVVEYAMAGWDDLCPAGGTVYLVETESGEPPYTLVCGLHDADSAHRTRLNANYARTLLEQALALAQKAGTPYPETLEVRLNGKTYTAQGVTQAAPLRRGTATTAGVEGTVLYYAIQGQSDFCADCGAQPGSLCYLCFADEEHLAVWRYDQGWTGDCYESS